MSATGLDPLDELLVWARLPHMHLTSARLTEYDRLMAQGGIEAVIEALRKEQTKQA